MQDNLHSSERSELERNSNRVYVLGHKYVLSPSQPHFSPRVVARAKMSLSWTQNIFIPVNINSLVIMLFEHSAK